MTHETDPDAQELASSDVEGWEEWFGGIGDEATRISVYRFDQVTAKQDYCGSLPADGFDVEMIRSRWGGGKFSLRAFGPVIKGSRPGGYMGHKILNIAGPYKDLSVAAEPESTGDRERRRADELAQRLEEIEATRDRDRIAALENAVRQLLEEVRNPPRQAQGGDAFKMALELVKELQARVVPHVETPMHDGRAMIEVFTEGLRVGSEMDHGDRPAYADVIERIGVPLLKLAERQFGQPSDLHANPPQDAPQDMSSPDSLRSALSRWVPTLVQWAASGRDPSIRADFIVDELPDVWRAELADFLIQEGGGAITRLIGWFPQLGAHREWVQKLVDALRFALVESDDEGEDGASEDGPRAVLGSTTSTPDP